MRTIIVLFIAIALGVGAAGVFGAEKYVLRKGQIVRTVPEHTLMFIASAIATVTMMDIMIFTKQEVFYPLPTKVIDDIAMIMIGLALVGFWLVIIGTMEEYSGSVTEDVITVFLLTLLAIIVLVVGVEAMRLATMGDHSVTEGIASVGGILVYTMILYRASIIGGNIRIMKLKRELYIRRIK